MWFATACHSGTALSEAGKPQRGLVCSSLPRVERLLDYVRFRRSALNRLIRLITIK